MTFRRGCRAVALAAALAAPGPLAARAQASDEFAVRTARLLAQRESALGGERPVERRALSRLYLPTDARPLWTSDGRPTRQALASIDFLRRAAEKGLESRDYRADSLGALARSLEGATGNVGELARFDVLLSRAVVHMLADLHLGRVPPSQLAFHLPESHVGLDLSRYALEVSRADGVASAFALAEPPFAGYAALEHALARYRALAADTTLRAPRRSARSIRPGDSYADVLALQRLLGALGDLAPGDTQPVDSVATGGYTGALVDAVIAFQRRHALDSDGVIGPATMAQLRVAMRQRVRQIELTLERWRWLPDRAPERLAVVNVPGFRLYVFEHDSTAARPALAMNVIVGQAGGRRGTPLFTGTMREVVFRPYWDVPPSIARKELIPLIRRDRSYADREALEIVRGGDDDAVVYPITEDNLARVAAGTLRLRQRPGDNNALGLVKFVFPNDYNVYMHGTPAGELFAQTRRDFSHGCIRVEDPAALAELVLRDQAPWDRAAIEAAMHGERTIRLDVERPVTVYTLYATAVARDSATIFFYPDIYGHDARLARALERR